MKYSVIVVVENKTDDFQSYNVESHSVQNGCLHLVFGRIDLGYTSVTKELVIPLSKMESYSVVPLNS